MKTTVFSVRKPKFEEGKATVWDLMNKPHVSPQEAFLDCTPDHPAYNGPKIYEIEGGGK
jgi:hypothetical protein